MEWSGTETTRLRLGVGRMALALVLAALLGAVGGLLWHSSGLGEGDEEAEGAETATEAEAAPTEAAE